MSDNGRANGHSSAGGDAEWIDQVIDRAGERASTARPPIVPEQDRAVPTRRIDETAPLPTVPRVGTNRPAASSAPTSHRPAAQSAPIRDQLAEIRWVDPTPSRPASEPIASRPVTAPPQRQLTPEAVGRSAWSEDLRQLGTTEPEGWDQLSWQDLDDGRRSPAGELPDPSPFVRLLREWGPVLLAAVVIALFTRLVLVQAYHIPSLSMAPTLQDGDRVIVNRLSYNFGEVERGQVVVFSTPPNQQSEANDLIKRVIALPGETIEFRDGDVFVDGLLVQEPYLAQQRSTRPRFDIPGCAGDERSPDRCTVPEDFVFVMGDNRTGSQDSRVFGPIPMDTIVGRAMLRVWPLPDIGQL